MRVLPSENSTAAPAIKVLQDPEATSTCTDQTSYCHRWKPYSNSKDFERDAWLIFGILFGLLFLGIGLHAAVCCIIRRRCRLRRQEQEEEEEESGNSGGGGGVVDNIKGEVEVVVVFNYSAGDDNKMAAAADCAICLSEFEEGERVMVLDGCKHGFHVYCIKEWLSSHSSCPICRATTSVSSSFTGIDVKI